MRSRPYPLSPQDKGRRMALYVFGAVGVLVALSLPVAFGVFLWGALVADGTVHVHHDGRGVAPIVVDGVQVAELEERGTHTMVLRRGDHTVVVGDTSYELEGLTGLDEYLLVPSSDTCFAVVEVTRVLYGGDPCEQLDEARVTCLYRRFPMRDVGGATFRPEDLPSTPGRMQTLWLPAPCEGIGEARAEELLGSALGCPGFSTPDR